MVDEPAESSRLSPLRMTDEEDAAELSITLSLELERRFPLEAGMTYADGDASSEHAAKATIPTAAMNL